MVAACVKFENHLLWVMVVDGLRYRGDVSLCSPSTSANKTHSKSLPFIQQAVNNPYKNIENTIANNSKQASKIYSFTKAYKASMSARISVGAGR